MSADRLLAALDDLEAQLRTLGIDLAASAAPGATDAEIDRIAEETGIVLPDEARAWFQWHNGPADPTDDFVHLPRTAIAPGWNLTSIDMALRAYALIQELVAQTGAETAVPNVVPPHVFPIIAGTRRGEIVVHTAGPTIGAVNVVQLEYGPPDPDADLPDLARLVELFAEGIRHGIIIRRLHDEDDELDMLPYDQLPPEYRTIFF